jgi:hypothetical protein
LVALAPGATQFFGELTDTSNRIELLKKQIIIVTETSVFVQPLKDYPCLSTNRQLFHWTETERPIL